MQASSLSNTRAGPSCTSDRRPAILISAPSGARLPLSTTTPPVGEIGSAGERNNEASGGGGGAPGGRPPARGGGGARAKAGASFPPPAVSVLPSRWPLAISALAIIGTP